MIEDYQDIDKEYKILENSSEEKLKNLNNISHKINAFHLSMINLKNDIISIPELSNTPFGFFDEILKNFIKSLDKNICLINDLILKQIKNSMKSFKFVVDENLRRLKDIKDDLSEAKINLINKKDEFYNFSKKNNDDIKKNDKKNKNKNNTEKDDELKFNYAIKDNYEQLYKYELNKMNEIIDENNERYNNLNIELNAMNGSQIIMIKDRLNEFANIMKNVGQIFNLLSSEITTKIESSKELNNNNILQNIDKQKQLKGIRFKKEKIENNEGDTCRRKSIRKVKKDINNKDKKNDLSVIKNPYIEEMDKDKFIDNIIQKIISDEEELKSKEITKLFNILKTNTNEVNFSKIFLYKIDKRINNILYIKNKKNFIHLSNVINDLCLNDKNNLSIFYKIIDISQMIAYKNIFLYYNLRKKNEYFSTKSLWVNLIDAILTAKLNNFLKNPLDKKEEKNKNNKVCEKQEEKEKEKEKEKEEKEKENEKENEKEKEKEKEKENEKNNLKKVFKKKGLDKNIKDYKKLCKTLTKDFDNFTKKTLFIILSDIIPEMCFFGVNEIIIEEIIEDYCKDFHLYEDQFLYLKNKIKVNNISKDNNIVIDRKEDLYMNNNIIILNSASKYLHLNELQNLFLLDKNIYKKLILNPLSNPNIPIQKILLFWNHWLKIDQLKNNYLYKDIKKGINISIFQNQIKKGTKERKNMEVIEQDLRRTYFLQKNPIHFNSIKSILNCFLLTFPQIGYCQGMNCVVSFLYQLLDEDEENTFYYLCGFELNTKYHELFEDDFITLSIFFKVFDNILQILNPDIYYIFKNNTILPNCYCSSWFITLFMEFILIFDKNNPPLLAFFILNKFILEGWHSIFVCGYMLIEISYEKIKTFKKEKLIGYVMNIFEEEKIFDNENYEKCKNLYLKNEKIINKYFIEKLIFNANYDHYNK